MSVVQVWGDGHCAACEATSPPSALMCETCWKKVPRRIAEATYTAFNLWRAGRVSLAVLRCVQMAAVLTVDPDASFDMLTGFVNW